MLNVYFTNVSALPSNPEGLTLSDYRLQKLRKLSVEQKHKQSIASELLLNYAVEHVLPRYKGPYEINVGKNGKPELKNIPLHFNISHSGEYAACAISDAAVGIDVETRARYNPDLIKRCCTTDEENIIENSPDRDKEFSRIWTTKESALKFLGSGFTKSLKSVNVISNNQVNIEPEKLSLKIVHKRIENMDISVCTASEALNFNLIYVNLFD